MSKQFASTTSETSDFPDDERQLDLTLAAVKRLMIMAYRNYNDAIKGGHSVSAAWWDGYIRACQQVVEMENE